MNILTIILIFLAIIIISAFIIFFDKLNLTFKVAIITIFLGISCLTLAFLPFGFFSKDVTNNINSTLIGFGTGLILTAITITFIQYFLDQQKIKIKEEIERKQERDDLIKLDRIITLLITKYILYFNCVTTPISKRHNNDNLELNIDFKFKDMQNLFSPSLLMIDEFNKPSIKSFFEYEIRLRNFMIDIIGKNNLKHHRNILNIFINFIQISFDYDFSSSILDPEEDNTKIASLIKNTENGSEVLTESSITPYVYLYNLLQIEGKLIIKYQNEIKKIKKTEEGN